MWSCKKVANYVTDDSGQIVRDASRRPLIDDFLPPFEDEVVRLLLLLLAERQWTGNRFEMSLIGTPLFLRRIRNKTANGWTGLIGGGAEIGRCDKSWKIFINGCDPNRITPDRALRCLNKGWRNLTPSEDSDMAPTQDPMGYWRGLGSVLPATEIKGDRGVFSQDMMMMRLYSTDQ